MTGHLVRHLVRRGMQNAQQHLTAKQQYIAQLEHDAELYEKVGQEVRPEEFLPAIITVIVAMLIMWSIDYTLGQVVSSLTMIESPTRTAIIESKPPPYADEPDAPLEKEPLMVTETDDDIEVTVIDHKPITAKITTSIGLLHRVGGFSARWRGLSLSFLYDFLHSLLAHTFMSIIGFGIVAEFFVYIFVSLSLARLHMAWTHKMISYPNSKSWFRHMPARKECKVLLLPTMVYAAAQQATIILPVGVALLLGVANPHAEMFHNAADHHDCSKLVSLGLRLLAVPVTFLTVSFLILVPASVTLTRIEASLLPEGEETIVPFDKEAMMGDIDLSARGSSRAIFVQAWRSFDRASRWRLIKLYAKMFMAQITIALTAAHLVVAEIYLMGGERIAIFLKSATAQLKLMAIEAHEGGN